MLEDAESEFKFEGNEDMEHQLSMQMVGKARANQIVAELHSQAFSEGLNDQKTQTSSRNCKAYQTKYFYAYHT